MTTIPVSISKSQHPPIPCKSFDANQPPVIRLYPLSNYTFGTKESQPEEDQSVSQRLQRLEEYYTDHGMRRSCEAVMVCHEHDHPHILTLQIANTFFKLPGDHLNSDDDEIKGFQARLDKQLSPNIDVRSMPIADDASQISGDEFPEPPSSKDRLTGVPWEISSCLAQWWRPNFETFMYPYLPGHVTRPKECKKIYFVQLPPRKIMCVPLNMRLLAVPLFELYENTQRYGPQLAALPHLLSRFRFEYVDENGEISAVTPGGSELAPLTKALTATESAKDDREERELSTRVQRIGIGEKRKMSDDELPPLAS